ncbi:hypothetical protein [Viridibacillus sp. FSL H8-0123]|uniref:hypothetical protein n=1 Tax=Viridibacillus sp. FSL H8-0123 TaxID=1928922 RepID=UPI00096F537E|nr:hypothetical protein [Viridibacillus sp. FSL H8-0123]OMC80922.1 hypothetical protein BK130_16500 [Viridibacillus sp. FSL H8-0123]
MMTMMREDLATLEITKKLKMPSNTQVEKDIRAFWFEHYPKRKNYSDDERILLAQEFTDEQFELWGVDAYHLPNIRVYHPAYFKTTTFKKVDIYDILADFIAAVNDTSLEKYKPYPSYTEEQEYHRSKKRKKHELHIFDSPTDTDKSQPGYTISPEDVEDRRVEELQEYHLTKEQLEQEIFNLKADAIGNARRLQKIYGGSVRSISKKIYKLTPENIKVCRVCKEWFYAKDKRTEVCDLTIKYKPVNVDGVVRYVATKQSQCWHERNTRKTISRKGSCPI